MKIYLPSYEYTLKPASENKNMTHDSKPKLSYPAKQREEAHIFGKPQYY
jgi:hypothetical protein